MKKITFGLCAVSLIWLCKLNYDTQELSISTTDLQSQLTQVQQENANLKDQFVALQRDSSKNLNTKKHASPTIVVSADHIDSPLDPVHIIHQQIDSIEFALKVNQDLYALDLLQKLKKSLYDYALADTLRQSLEISLNQDQLNIEEYHQQKLSQKNQVQLVLQKIDRQLQELLNRTEYIYQPKHQDRFWEKWLSIQKLEQPKTDLMYQKIILKEVQLHLLLAQQCLNAEDSSGYLQHLKYMKEQLKQVVGVRATDLNTLLIKAEYPSKPPVIQLTTTQLLK